MAPNDAYVLITMRVADVTEIAAGSTVTICQQCGSAVWIAPSSRQADIKVVLCLPCAMGVARRSGNALSFGMLPGAKEEVEDWLAKRQEGKGDG